RPAQPVVPAAAQTTAPVRGRVDPLVETERQISIEIRDRDYRQIITVVEMLSPSNKNPDLDRDQYLVKRNKVLQSGVNLVEINLLRGGVNPPVEQLPWCAYYVLVSRRQQRPEVDLWPIQLRDPLRVIPIPLRPDDAEPTLDLQAILHTVYDETGYETIMYEANPEPPLSPEDDAWARGLIPSTP